MACEPVLLGGGACREGGLADERATAALVEVQLGPQVAGGVGGAEPAVARQRRALLDAGEGVALVGADPQVGRDHRTRGGADHGVGVAHVDAAVAQADDDAGLPGDAGRSPTGEHEGPVDVDRRLVPLAEPLAADHRSREVTALVVGVDHVLAHHTIVLALPRVFTPPDQ